MKKAVLTLSLVLCAMLMIGNAVLASDDGKPAAPPATPGDAPASTRAPGSLTTHFNGGNGYAGNMFDIVPSFDMEITAIDIHNEGIGSACLCDVWYRVGTSIGFESSSQGWILMGNYTGTGAGPNTGTYIDMLGNGVTFSTGQTYGLYVNLISYGASGDRLAYTTGGPMIYSNSDLSIETNCGKGTPDFGGSTFYPREWNGTIYYDNSGPAIPTVDMKCNGDDAGVLIPAGSNAKIDFDVWAGAGTGTPVDIWIALKTPFGFFSYDGVGPISGWTPGLNNAYYTGPLADVVGTALDRPLPIGAYNAHGAIDTVPNGSLDMGAIFTKDKVDFTVY